MGGFALGLERGGHTIKNHYYSEIDEHAIAVYQSNFKNAKHVGSVTDVQRWLIDRPNIITFGSPCQDFSLSGQRKGLGGERSSLIEYAILAIERFRPDVFIWENVKGTFSSNDGADFWAIIQAFANIGGYRIQWQLLNTAWFLPQNRERIYLVGHLADGSGREIFPIRESDLWDDSEEGKAQGKGERIRRRYISACIDANYYKGHGSTRQLIQEEPVPGTWRTHKDGLGFREVKGGDSPTIPARAREDGSGQPVVKMKDARIRRLTPIECERLQGFPDNWTQLGLYNGITKEVSNTQRYKLCGNAVTVDVVAEIARRL
jgi:DNA (cytosine-5)-methyltransferase 1